MLSEVSNIENAYDEELIRMAKQDNINLSAGAKRTDRIQQLAVDVLNLSKNTLIVNLRFMDKTLSMLKYACCDQMQGTSVDGKVIYYNPVYVLKQFKADSKSVVRQYLHMVLHCVFQHYWIGTLVNYDYWNLACDIAVEAVINDLSVNDVMTNKDKQQKIEIEHIKKSVKYVTADMLYNFLLDNPPGKTELTRLNDLFSSDHHDLWYSGLKIGKDSVNDGESLAKEWKNIARQLMIDIDMFNNQRGDTAGSLVQNLAEVTREKQDYTKFLQKFAVFGEKMKINMDEFDYIFYTYGLSTYGNMPLIEPLEYKESKQVKEFVIAIDTSGSTSGELVQMFIQKTFNILKGEENFFTRFNLHIIQCDAKIQEAVKITNQKEFDDYLSNMKIRGLGGTDFRPVFRYVDSLIEQKEFSNLKGMLYFTDGYGIFPKKQPSYKVAVIYVDDGYDTTEVPAWAIKMVLKPMEIREMFS